MNNPKDERCKQYGWAFVGYYTQGKHECSFPIGVYSEYRDGAAQANAWMKHEKRGTRWEGEQIYEDCDE
jgi:hypothetical protein